MAKTQIKDYVFKPGMSRTGYVYPNAYALLYGNKYYIQKEATAWIASCVIPNFCFPARKSVFFCMVNAVSMNTSGRTRFQQCGW